jgi:phosphatidylglycerophosphatase A
VTGKGQTVGERIGLLVATFGNIGYAPVAPGTFGSAAALPIYWLLRTYGCWWAELGLICGLFVLGVWASTVAERQLGGQDPAPIVIDEVVGMLITLAWLPVNTAGAIVGFVVFRILDVVKPWPSARFESLHGGLGVMADDAMAAIYGNLIMRLLIALAPMGWLA